MSPDLAAFPNERPTSRNLSLAALALLVLALPAGAVGQDLIPLHRLEGSVVIDGVVDEPAWELLTPLHITQKVPVAGAPPSQATEIRIGYDSEHIYLSGRLYDSEPDRIVANTKKRDDFTENTEWVGLLVDTYDDRENALGFWVTPTGAKLDMAISDDAASINTDWDSDGDARATRSNQGWFAEIRIPLSSLPLAVVDGRTVVGITTWRYLARNDETAIYPPRGLSSGSSFRPALTQRFVLEGVVARPAFSVTPYALGGRSTSSVLTAPGERFRTEAEHQTELGVDARLGLGGSLTVDLTVNTDFAQVEVDDQQVNLTRFNLFFPEKRRFFQERASLFDFGFGLEDRVFHSRRIGIVDGRQVPIYGGARAVGKRGPWEMGFLTMQTHGSGTAPSENFSVLRATRRVLNESSSVGFILTSRAGGSSRNSVYGLDATLRLIGENFLSARWSQSLADETRGSGSGLASTRVFLELADRSPLGFTYGISLDQSGSAFDPSVGFQSRGDFAAVSATAAYNVFPGRESPVLQIGPFVNGSAFWDATSRLLETRTAQAGLLALSKSGWTASAFAQSDLEVLSEPLDLAGGLTIDPGRYSSVGVGASLATPSSQRLSGSLSGSAGGFFGGRRVNLQLAPFVTVTPDLLVSGSYRFDRIWFPPSAERPSTTVGLADARLDYFFSTRVSVSILLQHNSIERLFIGSLRFRYNPSEGNDLYVVFNGDANQDRDRLTPVLPWSNRSALQVKYSYTFRM